MNVFISWSGRTSRSVALALREFIQDVIQAANPWMSEADIEAGKRWSPAIASKLEESKFGIVCLTGDNLNAPWILFETGAIAKSLEDTYVCPYLFNMEPSNIPPGPLSQFQAKRNNQAETLELFSSINRALGENAIKDEVLERVFKRSWPDFVNKLNKITLSGDNKPIERTEKEILKEVLDIVRRMERQQTTQDDFNQFIAPFSFFLKRLIRPFQFDTTAIREKINQMTEKGLNADELVHYLVLKEGIDQISAQKLVQEEFSSRSK